ncbi:MAG: O-antigen polysaccharide polymerase Wzy [Planctomycetota bacterium]
MSERLLLSVPTLAVLVAALWSSRRRSPLSPTVVALGATAVVATFFPLLSALVRPLSWRHGVHLSSEHVLAAQVQYLGFALGLAATCASLRLRRAPLVARASRPLPRRGRPGPTAADARARDGIVAAGLVVGGALLYSVYVWKVGLGPLLDRSNFAEKYRVSSGLGTFYAGLNLILAGCLWAEASDLARRSKNVFRACAFGVLVWAVFFIAVRTYAATLVLGYLYLWTVRRGFTLSRVRPTLVLLVALSYVGVEAYALLRSVWHGGIGSAVEALHDQASQADRMLGQVIGGSEFSHPFLTQMELGRYEQPGALGGASYLQGVHGLAPSWLVPDRGPTVAQTFARSHYPELAERGGGTAFSLVGEAWWNFGSFVGPLVLGLLCGALLSRLERSLRTVPLGVPSRIVPYALHLVLLAHRNSSASLLKQAFVVALPLALLLCAAALLRGASRTRRPRLAPLEVS